MESCSKHLFQFSLIHIEIYRNFPLNIDTNLFSRKINRFLRIKFFVCIAFVTGINLSDLIIHRQYKNENPLHAPIHCLRLVILSGIDTAWLEFMEHA